MPQQAPTPLAPQRPTTPAGRMCRLAGKTFPRGTVFGRAGGSPHPACRRLLGPGRTWVTATPYLAVFAHGAAATPAPDAATPA